jgi:hypothetical protein
MLYDAINLARISQKAGVHVQQSIYCESYKYACFVTQNSYANMRK